MTARMGVNKSTVRLIELSLRSPCYDFLAVSKRLLLALPAEDTCRHLTQRVFEPAGFSVTVATQAADLRRHLRSRRADVLFLGDFAEIDSFELAEQLKSSQPTLPIVFLARDASPEQLLRGVQMGLVDYLILPVEDSIALEAASRGLERKRRWEGWLRKETGRITGPLARRLSELESILQQVNDGVMLVDAGHKVLMVNLAMRRALSLNERDVQGHPVEEVIDNRDLLRLLAGPLTESSHFEIQSPNGRTYDARLSHIEDLGIAISLHDITNLKELDHLRKDFVNTVSHDLRSPLTAILGYVELIERAGPVTPQQAEFIKRVKSSVHTTTELIDDLLDLGRVEVGLVDEVESVDLKGLLSRTVEELRSQIELKEQIFKLVDADSLPPVRGNQIQLGQMVANLVGNAIKYTPVGGEIRVMLRAEQNQLILHVADSGPGIPLDEQGKIFEKFYRASNTQRLVAGTGLGLAIVKTIVENHHGRIWVDSKVGGGSIFTVVLPLVKS